MTRDELTMLWEKVTGKIDSETYEKDDIVFFATNDGTKYEVTYTWNATLQDWDEQVSATPLEIKAGKIYIDHISFDMFTSPYAGAWIQLNAIEAATYDGTTKTAETSISAAGVISKTASGVTKTYDLPAESGTLARKEETLPNKTYAPAEFSGLGRKYLQKNIVDVSGTDKNVLTQAMFSDANTIYVIQYDYDLNGQSITIPSGIELKFEGGSISNGTLTGASTTLSGDIRFGLDVNFSGTFKCDDVDPRWFGAVSATFSSAGYAAAQDFALYAAAALKLVAASKMALYIPAGYWVVKTPILWTPSFVKIIGEGDRSVITLYKQTGSYPVCFNFNGATVGGYVRDLYFMRDYISGETTYYRGTIFENVVFSGARISNILLNRAGIFIRGQIKACTEVSKCHIVNLGYSFISAYTESEFETSAAYTGGTICCIDSFITDNYINSVTTNASGAIPRDKTMLSGAVSSTVVSGNFIDFWKYIIRRSGDGGNGVNYNIFNGNIFDYCFAFAKGNFKPYGFTFTNNTIWHCYYDPSGSWGQYASDDTDLTAKKWCFMTLGNFNYTTIKDNAFIDGDYAFNNVRGAYPTLYSEIDFPERYTLRQAIARSNVPYDGSETYINGDKIYKTSANSYMLSAHRLLSNVTYTRLDSGDKTIFDFGKEYYPLQVANRPYGTFFSADLYECPAKLGAGYRLTVLIDPNPVDDYVIVKETINDEDIYVIKRGSTYQGVVYHDDLFKLTSLFPTNSALLILDLNIYVVYTGSSWDFYKGFYEATDRTYLIVTTLPSTAKIGRVAVVMDGDTPVWYKYDYDGWTSNADTIKRYFPKKNHGTTANRPYTYRYVGMEYFDETIGQKVVWNGTAWVNLDGTALS